MLNSMQELIKYIENGELWAYELEDGGTGIVIADNSEQAELKVREAYLKHGGYDKSGIDATEVRIYEIVQKPFVDAPNVLEICV